MQPAERRMCMSLEIGFAHFDLVRVLNDQLPTNEIV